MTNPKPFDYFVAKFWSHVDKTAPGGCWRWTGYHLANGYAQFYAGGGYGAPKKMVHRFSYELKFGNIPAGLEIDHLCSVRDCVNPAHLEAVTHRVNMHRTPNSMFAVRASRTHCARGHAYTPENTYFSRKRPNSRNCRACRAASTAKRRERLRDNAGQRTAAS